MEAKAIGQRAFERKEDDDREIAQNGERTDHGEHEKGLQADMAGPGTGSGDHADRPFPAAGGGAELPEEVNSYEWGANAVTHSTGTRGGMALEIFRSKRTRRCHIPVRSCGISAERSFLCEEPPRLDAVKDALIQMTGQPCP